MKDPAGVKVRFALCYPDIYEVGMSYYGHFLLYELANRVPGVWCERCYAPWHDMEEHLRRSGTPLYTLESRTPLGRMDLIGFTLSYELNVTNVLTMLDLAGIPLRATERTAGPVVIGGGPLMLNPAPYEGFFDLVVVGEADEVLPQILLRMEALKGEGRDRIVGELAALDGVYSPLLRVDRVKRLFVRDLDGAFHPMRPPIPVVGAIHNRLNVEVSRGCGNGCRFCLAGFGYRPYRERSLERVKAIVDEAMGGTGYEEISFLSLSTGDYSALFDIIAHVRERYRGVMVSLPSLKIGSIREEEIRLIGDVARTGLTFALESPAPGVRCRLNKNIDVDVLLNQLPVLRRYGWRRLKLYLMVGFPWETPEDLWSIREVIGAFEKGGMDVNLSVAPFTPKPHTPFQWLPVEDPKILEEKMVMVKRALKGKRARVRYRDVKTSLAEALVARGDRRLESLFTFAFSRGARLEAWRECFRYDIYEEWSRAEGIDLADYLKGRSPDGALPWDFVDLSFDPLFLRNEWDKAEKGEGTVDCYGGCSGCGLGCTPARRPEPGTGLCVTAAERGADGAAVLGAEGVTGATDEAGQGPVVRYVLRYGKYGDARYIGHLDTMNILLRALRSMGVSIRTHGKYHPLPKVSLTEAMPVGVESTCEYLEMETEGPWPAGPGVLRRLNERLPGGMRVYEAEEGTLKGSLKPFSFLLVANREVDGEDLLLVRNRRRHYYLWKGKGVKRLWGEGVFTRIIKIEDRRTHGIRADH